MLTIEEQQDQSIRSLQTERMVGTDGSLTQPQITTTVSPLDGELPRPSSAGISAYRKARVMRRDPTIRMVRTLAMAPIIMADWEYKELAGAPVGAKELVEDVLGPMRPRLVQTSLAGMIDYGWQPYEVINDPWEDGTSAIRLKPLLQDLTTILVREVDGSYYGLRQDPVPGLGRRAGWVYLNSDESLVISQDVEGTNWYGESTMASLEAAYDEGELAMKASRKYDAKVAGTHWIVYYPIGVSTYQGSTVDNGEVARRLLMSAEAVGGICVPRSVINTLDALNAQLANSEASQWKIDLLSDKGSGAISFESKLKYIDVLKARAFGWPERAVFEGQFGTKAEAEAHADIAVSGKEAQHAMLCSQYNDKIVDRLLLWNYGPKAVGTIKVLASPLTDKNRKLFETVYAAFLANPEGFAREAQTLDMDQMRDRLGLPELEVSEDPYAEMLQQEPQEQPPLQLAWDESKHPRDPGGEGGGQFVDKAAAHEHYSKKAKGWAKSLTKAEQKALSDYKLSWTDALRKNLVGATVVNNALTNGTVGKREAAAIKNLDSLISKAVLDEDTVVYHGSFGRIKHYNGRGAPVKKGDDFKWPAYMSTSSERSVAEHGKASGDLMRIKLPKGSNAAYLDAIYHDEANEFLLPRGQSLRVTNITKNGKQRILDVEVIKELSLSAASDRLDRAATRTANPTKAQAEAGNYRKGKLRVHGMTVTIETPKGERRKPEWPKLPAHYGYVNRTEGADGDHVDCFVGKHPDCELAHVIDQHDPKTGAFDEHKVMLGYKSRKKAREAYAEAYGDGRRAGPTTTMTMAQFREWLKKGDTTRPLSEQM